ncbi:MAG: twitch domain-containing radical SAM protein [Methylocella sp.]
MPTDARLRNGRAFCMAPWVNLSVAIGGVARPCCEIDGDFGNLKEQSIQDIWHGQAFRDFRAKMLRDERDERCWKCYEKEETGGLSMRNGYNTSQVRRARQLGGDTETGGQAAESLVPTLPITLDIRFSNLCNFTCRTCGHAASSKWFTEARKMGWTAAPDALIATFNSTEAGLRALRPLLATVEEIYFAGGEPLLIEQHYAVLNELIAQGRTDVSLAYNTNMSELRLGRLDVMALWSRFKYVYLGVSVDGTGARGELIREGMSWTNFVAKVSAVKQRCPHVRVGFCVTVSVFNVWALPELYRDLVALEGTGARDVHFNVLQEPKHYSVQILPDVIKREIRRRLEGSWHRAPNATAGAIDCSIQGEFRHIIDHMMAENRTDLIERFRSVTLRLDAMRNKSTAAICPELAPLLGHPAFPMVHHYVRVASCRAVRFKKWLAQA